MSGNIENKEFLAKLREGKGENTRKPLSKKRGKRMSEKYNGFTNWETWHMKTMIGDSYDEDYIEEMGFRDAREFANYLESDMYDNIPRDISDVYKYIIQSNLREVNWEELANSIMNY
jgi:hypothetical protein